MFATNYKHEGFENTQDQQRLLPSEYPAAPVDDRKKYSLFTQFLKHSGMLPMIARRISLAAISRNSVVAASL